MKYYTIYKKFKHTCNAYLQNDAVDNCWYKPSPVFFLVPQNEGFFQRKTKSISHTHIKMLTRMPRKNPRHLSHIPPPHLIFLKCLNQNLKLTTQFFLFTSYLISDITYLSVKAFLFKIITLGFFYSLQGIQRCIRR